MSFDKTFWVRFLNTVVEIFTREKKTLTPYFFFVSIHQSFALVLYSENHWRAKKMDVLLITRPAPKRKFPDHYRSFSGFIQNSR